jgi:gamma-glutamylcyclotransferase (GGCT)/AIG2-like uncharacterized protein YtfP
MTDLLFVYGTLLQSGNAFAEYLKQHCNYLLDGKIKGLLFDIGDYPGLILSTDAEGYVYGSIYQLNNINENLKIIDNYEGFGPDQDQPNLFVRVNQPVETGDGILNAWIYVYNLPLNGHQLIVSGRYNVFLNQKSPGY